MINFYVELILTSRPLFDSQFCITVLTVVWLLRIFKKAPIKGWAIVYDFDEIFLFASKDIEH